MVATRRTSGRLAAVILAGGRGTRLGGVIKANLKVGGVRLFDRVLAALSDVSGPMLVAHGGVEPTLLNLPGTVVPIADPPGWSGGPLAGIAAAVQWCRAQPSPPELLVSVAVDTPFFPADFVPLALARMTGGSAAVVSSYAGQPYPTNALWRIESLGALLADPTAGVAGINGLLAQLSPIAFEWPESPAGDPFASVNTPVDLAMLQARAARLSHPEFGVGKAGQTR